MDLGDGGSAGDFARSSPPLFQLLPGEPPLALIDLPLVSTFSSSANWASAASAREMLASRLRATPEADPRPEFVRDLQPLMSAADTLLVPADGAWARPPPRPLASRCRPRGDAETDGSQRPSADWRWSEPPPRWRWPPKLSALHPLYPVKRAIESVHTGLSTSDADRGEVLLANAADRLGEVSALSRGEDVPDPLVVADTLDAFAGQAGDASDLLMDDYARHGRESSIRDFDAASLSRLTALEPLVPASARDELMDAARLLFQMTPRPSRPARPAAAPASTRCPAPSPRSPPAPRRSRSPPPPSSRGPVARVVGRRDPVPPARRARPAPPCPGARCLQAA